jgi:hypothetical protein
MKKISVTLPDELHDRFHGMIPARTRSRFVSSVLEEALERKERQSALDEINNFKPFKVNRDSVKVLRDLRSKRKSEYIDNLA